MVFGKLISDKNSVLARVEAAGSKQGAPNRDVRIVAPARLAPAEPFRSPGVLPSQSAVRNRQR